MDELIFRVLGSFLQGSVEFLFDNLLVVYRPILPQRFFVIRVDVIEERFSTVLCLIITDLPCIV